MNTYLSSDGTKIAYDKKGHGPVIIVVLGALNSRKSGANLAKLLAADFTVINYDRRGRGDSSDVLPYTPEHEVEDLTALINEIGEPVYLYGHSSGAAIALKASIKLGKTIKKLAIYEVPYSLTDDEIKSSKAYDQKLKELLASGNKDEAVALFIRHVGVSEKQIAAIKRMSMWKGLVAMAQTLAYDSTILGDGYSLPTTLLGKVVTPTLVMHGEKGSASIANAARLIGKTIPNAQLLAVKGQDHGVSPKSMAPILKDYFN